MAIYQAQLLPYKMPHYMQKNSQAIAFCVTNTVP